MGKRLWFASFLPRVDTGMTEKEHAYELAFAIQRFRNNPLLKDLLELRGTEEYSALCQAWKHFVEDYPEAQLPRDAT